MKTAHTNAKLLERTHQEAESHKYFALLQTQIRALKLPDAVRELVFHPERKWRFDGAWPHAKIAFEIQGGTWSSGRHVRGNGYANDCEKLNEAVLLGWRLFWFTSQMVEKGIAIQVIERALRGPK